MRLPEVLEFTELSRTTIWRWETDGVVTPPVRFGGERTWAKGWREQDVYDWIDNLFSGSVNRTSARTRPSSVTAYAGKGSQR